MKSSRSRIKRASKRNPCPICNGTGCGIGEQFVFCHRVEAGSLKKNEVTGAFKHPRVSVSAQAQALPRFIPPRIVAPIARRHEVFTAWLSCLELSYHHRESLQAKRGLSQAMIERQMFRTVPDYLTSSDACHWLADILDLAHVPGFYFDTKRQRWQMRFANQRGFYIPLRDELGRIHALQIRRDTDDPKSRYWLVSTPPDEFDQGASSGVPPHFVGNPDAERLVITEGGLKAIACSERMPHVWFCGLVAVGSFDKDFGWYLRERLPRVTEVAIAFDRPEAEASERARENVAAQLARLKATLATAGYNNVVEMDWPAEQGKGLDDYLLNQRKVTA